MMMKQQRQTRKLWWIGSLLVLAAFLLFQPGGTAVHADGSISGTVFRDFNSNGLLDANEPGIGGITVTAVSDTGDTRTTTTDANGTYTLTPDLVGNEARVEFTLPTDGSLDFLKPSVAGGTTVQFVDISNDVFNVNAGFLNPAQYALAAAEVVAPRFQRGENVLTTNQPVIQGHDYNLNSANPPLTVYANADQVGTIYGMAYQSSSEVLFGSTYIRRGAGVGPSNLTGTIYKLSGSGAPSNFFEIANTGANPHPNGMGHNFVVDTAGYSAVGKVGLGDLEISDDEQTLYAVNLNTRELVIMPLTFDSNGQPVAPAPGDVTTEAIPVPTTCDGDGVSEPAATDWRPFALKYFDGTLYVGGVCSGESMIAGLGLNPATSTFADLAPIRPFLDAVVYEFNPQTGAFNTTPILTIDLDYAREAVNDGMLDQNNDGEWLPWTDFWRPNWAGRTGGNIVANPQPILADIEFDGYGFMFLGFRDRFADQAYDRGDPGPSNGSLTNQRFGGDLLLACQTAGGGWQLESGPVEARICNNGLTGVTRTATNPPSPDYNPGSPLPEFFHNDQYLPNGGPTALYHDETFIGSLAVLLGSGELVGTKYDAFATFEAGTITFDTDNGNRLRAAQMYEDTANTFGKAGGMGDIELLGAAAPVEVGNRVWRDENGNGIQDPGEPPIAGVTVELHDADGALLAATTTDANGLYYFSNYQPIGAVSARISLGSDDARQPVGGATLLSENELMLGNNNDSAQQGFTGLRFQNLAIPVGATITSAYIQFSTDDTPTNIGNPANFTIDGQNTANPPTFTTAVNNISGRPRTAAQVAWVTPNWSGPRISSADQRTPDLTPIVQEIVNLAGWAPGNAMVFIINPSADHRNAESFNTANGVFSPALVVNYVLPTPANYAALEYRSGYQLRVDLNQAALNGLSVSPPQADSSAFGDIRDSDGQPRAGGYVAIDFTTGGPGENNHSFDFGFAPLTSLGDFIWDDQDNDGFYDGPVQVGDFVWYDLDGDGLQDTGEPGVSGVRAALHRSTDTDCADLPLATTTTGPDGRYLFTDLPPGNYFVCFTLVDLPAGFVVTVAGGDNAADATGRTGNTGPLAAGQQNLTRDMGIVNTAGLVSVGDKVWYDLNGNGRQDPNEPGVPGVTVRLFTLGQVCTDTPVASQTTDENGLYLFTGLTDGNYFVCFDLTTIPAGYGLTAANNQLDDSVDSDADANGQTPPTGPLTAGQFDYTLDMGIVSAGNVSVGDYVWYDDNGNGLQDAGEGGVPGIGVALHSAADTDCADTPLVVTTTGGDGSYLFSGLPSGSYFVCFDLSTIPGGFEVTSQNVGGDDTIDSDADPTTGATAVTGIIPANGADLTLDMGIRQDPGLVSVGDRVWYDNNRNGVQDPGEMGVPGVAVDLHPATNTDCADTPADTTATDAQGNYLFGGLTPGDYFVCFGLTTIPTGYVVTLPDQGGDDGADSDADPTTGQTPATGALAAGQSNMTLDMGIYAPDHEIRLPGVTVQLYAAAQLCDGTSYIAEVTTDANGYYLFTGLPGGQYYVHIPASNFAPGGAMEYMFATLFTDPNPDDDLNNDNSAQEVTAGACAGGLSTNLVTLAIITEPLNDGTTDRNTPDNSNNLTVDMAAYEPVCLGDQVWYDADDSGTLNGAEYGINGITLDLYLDVDDDGIFEPGGDDGAPIATTVTANVGGQDGSYSFCTLIPGNYFVHIPPTQFVAGALLNQTRSSTTVVNPVATVAEDDNNGTDGGDAATNGIVVATRITLDRRVEPTFDRDINDNGRRDSSTNQTVDFGITLNEPMDFGDLPDTYNNTIFGDDGPRHPDTNLYLGVLWDADNDGQESTATDGDDNDGNDDEDGVIINVDETWGDGEGIVEITVSGGSGCVLGWVDFSGDGNFDDEVDDGSGNPLVSEFLFARFLGTGTTQESFTAPRSSVGGGLYVYPNELNMRFRIFPPSDPLFAARGVTLDGNGCPAAGNTTATMTLVSVGAASGGEVEDYQHQFSPTAVNLQHIRATLGAVPFILVLAVVMALAFTGLGIALARRRV